MDTAILSEATLMFRQASLGWADVLRPFMETFLFDLIMLQWALLGILYFIGTDVGSVFGMMLRFVVGNGFALYMVRDGWRWVDSWFRGIKTLGYYLGSPDLDPSAVAAWGWVVADPITKSLAAQGFLSYATSPTTWIFGLGAEFFLLAAFALLAFILMGLLIVSYFLIAACPFFFAFWGLSFTREITMGYVRLVFGTLCGLFAVMLTIAVANELGALLHQQLRTQFLAPGVTLTMGDYVVPLVIGVVLCFLFIWLPYKFTSAVGGIMGNWVGGYSMFRIGNAAMMAMGRVGSSGQSQSSGNQSTQPQLSSPQQGMPQQQAGQRSGAWGRRP